MPPINNTLEKILMEFDKKYRGAILDGVPVPKHAMTPELFSDLKSFLTSACKKYAMSCVPSEVEEIKNHDDCLCESCMDIGWNDCKEAMIKNIEQ